MGTKEILNNIANNLYKGDVKLGISKMMEVIPGLQTEAEKMDEGQQQDFLDNALVPALQAMESEDATLLADVIVYEIMERIND